MNKTEYGVYVEYPWSTKPLLVEDGFFSKEEAESFADMTAEDDETNGGWLVIQTEEFAKRFERRNS